MKPTLLRSLGLSNATSIVVGGMIGTGIFLKTTIMLHTVHTALWVIVAWLSAGLLSLAGALTYAELGARFPEAGGEYVFLRNAYSDRIAFLYGWMRFWIGSPGSIAAYAVGASTFFLGLLGRESLSNDLQNVFAVSTVFIFTILNCRSVRTGGLVQTFLTLIKIAIMVFVILGCFLKSEQNSGPTSPIWGLGFPGISSFGKAVLAALWAFDGWNALPMLAGEIKRPEKNIPLALGLGTLLVLSLYLLINIAYFRVLPTSEILSAYSRFSPNSISVATKATQTFLGHAGIAFLSVAMIISALGAMNGSMLAGARVPFAMARDGIFFAKLGVLNRKTSVPVYAVMFQGFIAAILAISGTFDQLTDAVVFASWIFYALVAFSLFKLRAGNFGSSTGSGGYRTPGYPMVPIIFVGASVLLLINTVFTQWRETLLGLLVIGLGLPAYAFFSKGRTRVD